MLILLSFFHCFSASKSTEIKSKPNQTVKTTVIEAKTSSSPTNSRLKLTKFSVKQTSPLRTSSANKDKKTTTNNTTLTTTTAGSTTSSTHKFVTVDKKNVTRTSSASLATTSPSTSTGVGGFNLLKTDLPGRVSFSKNDVYEIDYSDFENDTDTSRSLDQIEPFRKKNVHFEDEYFSKFSKSDVQKQSDPPSPEHEVLGKSPVLTEPSQSSELNKSEETEKYCCPLKCNSLRCKSDSNASIRLEVLPEDAENGQTSSTSTLPLDSSEKIIEDYKREIENINRQHDLELKWNGNKTITSSAPLADYLNNVESTQQMPSPLSTELPNGLAAALSNTDNMNERRHSGGGGGSDSWSSSPNHGSDVNLTAKSKLTSVSNTSDESPTRDSTSTVINNYLKVTNQQKSGNATGSSATIKLKTTKRMTPQQSQTGSETSSSQRKIKSATNGKSSIAANRMTKARSIGNLQNVTDVKLNEFQIDKVESWMSTHEDTFSDAGALNSYRKHGKFGSSSNLEYKKAWRETPISKTDDEGNFSLDDQVDSTSIDGSTYGEIELVLKKLEGRRMKISFDPIKSSTSVPTLSIASSGGSQQTQNLSISTHIGSTPIDQSSDKIK